MGPWCKIIIRLSSINRETASLLFRLIQACVNGVKFEPSILDQLKSYGHVFIFRNPLTADIVDTTGLEDMSVCDIDSKVFYCFTIIVKAKDVSNPSDIVPLLLLQREYDGLVAIGIDLGGCKSIQEQQSISFKFSNFLLFVDDIIPSYGRHSLYFIDEKKIVKDKETGLEREVYLSTTRASILRYKSNYDFLDSAVDDASRYFQPLLHVDKTLFGRLFQNVSAGDSLEIRYIDRSISKLSSDLNNTELSQQGFSSLFEKWLFLAFYRSFTDSEDDLNGVSVDALNATLHDYYIGIYELVQNIIFHTEEQEGWLYVVFCKEEDLSEDDRRHMSVCIEQRPGIKRYLKIGVCDFSKLGIADTFSKNNSIQNITLSDLIDPEVILDNDDTDNVPLSLTYAAHLGIKMLVSSVLYHNGWFRVESCQKGAKYCLDNSASLIRMARQTWNVAGSHYEILLPLAEFQRDEVYPIQVSSVNDFLKSRVNESKDIDAENIDKLVYEASIKDVSSPSGQWQWIDDVANKTIELFNSDPQSRALGICALNMKGNSFQNPNQILKLLAQIQLRQLAIKTIVLVNLSDSIVNHLCLVMRQVAKAKTAKKQPLWSRDYAVVLYGSSFVASILSGETVCELEYVNQRMCRIYQGYPNNLARLGMETKDEQSFPQYMDHWCIPYECIIRVDGTPLFLHQVRLELDKPIGNVSGGYLVDAFCTKLGSKLYMERFYEADTMFQNGFFVDRFAFFIAKDLLRRYDNYPESQKKPIVIIGYLSYAEPLSRRVQYYINQTAEGIVSEVITAREDSSSNDMVFHWHNMQRESLSVFDDKFVYATIVPISSTLSSHDKTISLFKKYSGNSTLSFPFQYSVLLIHDRYAHDSPTRIEEDWGIMSVSNGSVTAEYYDTKQVTYLIEKESLWHNLLDHKTYPKDFQDEVFLNRTKNASLNTADYFGFPTAALPASSKMEDELRFIFPDKASFDNLEEYFTLTCKRLKEFGSDIQIGHIEHHGNHHRYFFDTEGYVGRNASSNREYEKWLEYQKNRVEKYSISKASCVIITPDVNKESCLVDRVNELVFGGNALVVHLDVFSSAQNISYKYSFLRQLPEDSMFFFVDHAILTGGTFERARLLMSFAKRNREHVFEGMITVVNRLSSSLFNQVSAEVGHYGIESYIWFSILPSKNIYGECSLCGLEHHYTYLGTCSVIREGRSLCEHNKQKFDLADLQHYSSQSGEKRKPISTADDERRMSRMFARYKLFYHISLLSTNRLDGKGGSGEEPAELLDEKTKSEKVLKYLQKEYRSVFYDVDSKISFLKAITFPPLSQYVNIRQFAFRTNLKELSRLLAKEDPEYIDFCLLRVVLKHLSYLSSNALVRREVLIGSWRLCLKVLSKTERSLSSLEGGAEQKAKKVKKGKGIGNANLVQSSDLFYVSLLSQKEILESFKADMLFYVKNAIHNDESKSFFLGELLRTGKEPDVMRPLEMHRSLNTVFTEEFNGVDDFAAFLDWLYYDNNAIMRKTLANFEKELEKKATGLDELFKDEGGKLLSFEKFEENVNSIVESLLSIVKDNYYYTWFRLYVTEDSISKGQLIDKNRDDVDLVRKLVYVLYAKRLLYNIKYFGGNGFVSDVNTLLQVALHVMEAKEAFVSISYDKRNNILASSGDGKRDEFVYSSYADLVSIIKPDLYFSPLLIIENAKQFYNFSSIGKGCFLPLYDERLSRKLKRLIGVVAFLFDDNSSSFKIKKRECGRLLMLLNEDVNEYIAHCKEEKFVDIWYEQEETRRKYRKTNFTSNHRLHLGNWDFESLDKDSFVKIHGSLFMLSNVVVSHLYSVICEEKKLDFFSRLTSISTVFSDKFMALLDMYNSTRWDNCLEHIDLGGKDFPLNCNLIIMQSLIIQCLDNAYGKYASSSKQIKISFRENSFSIHNSIMGVDEKRLREDKFAFEHKYNKIVINEHIENSKLSDYGMTLVSLFVYCESVGLDCNWVFDIGDNPFFEVTVTTKNTYHG